jgi:hypothetical protein
MVSLFRSLRKRNKEPKQRMAQRTVAPDKIKTLRDWVRRWPKSANLGFDEETREPTIYSADAARTKVSSIPWRREGDMLTILAQPDRFAGGAVDAARKRYENYKERQIKIRVAAETQIRVHEATLLEAWRAYHAAPSEARGLLRRDIAVAERQLRETEEALASQQNVGRTVITVRNGVVAYTPSIPLERRGISLEAAAAGAVVEGDASEEPSL